MEATELVGRKLTKSDYAIRSRAVGDDLDSKVSRASLDLQRLREDVADWQARLNTVTAIMRRYKGEAQHAVHEMLTGLLEEPPRDDDVAETMTMAGGIAMANEILVDVNAAGTLLSSHLEQREKLLGAEVPNLKGRVRIARQELRRYQDIAETAQRTLTQNPHLPYADTQRLQLEVSAYTRRQRELGQLESGLVDPKTYRPQSEAEHLRHLVISALTAGGK